jgi:hypothetical protein
MKTTSQLLFVFLLMIFVMSCKGPAEKIQGNWTLESTEVTSSTGLASDQTTVDMMKQIYANMNGQIWSFTQAEYKFGASNSGGVWYMDKDKMIITLNGEYGEQKMNVDDITSDKLVLSSENNGIKITHYLHKNKD